VQELGRLKAGADFEVSNQKRLMRRQFFDEEKEKMSAPRYSYLN
jgi:hypothetical protein